MNSFTDMQLSVTDLKCYIEIAQWAPQGSFHDESNAFKLGIEGYIVSVQVDEVGWGMSNQAKVIAVTKVHGWTF